MLRFKWLAQDSKTTSFFELPVEPLATKPVYDQSAIAVVDTLTTQVVAYYWSGQGRAHRRDGILYLYHRAPTLGPVSEKGHMTWRDGLAKDGEIVKVGVPHRTLSTDGRLCQIGHGARSEMSGRADWCHRTQGISVDIDRA